MTNLILSVISALCIIESANRSGAIGDGGRAVGILQMWPIAVAEANRIENRASRLEGRRPTAWVCADRTDPEQSKAMAFTTLKFHYERGCTNAIDLGCRWRNPYSRCPEWYREKLRRCLCPADCADAKTNKMM